MSEAKPLVPIRLAGVPEPFNLPWLLALERRAFVRAGIEVKWRTVPQGTGEMCRLLREGEVDMAVLVTEGAVRDIALGSPARIVGTLVDSPLTWGVHVGATTDLQKAEDLVGMPYAISRFNSGSHLMAMEHARQKGWTPTEKDLVVVNDLNGAVERLQAPEPAIFLWEKSMTTALVDAGKLRRVEEFNGEWPAFVVVARDAFLAEHAVQVDLLLRVFRDQARGLMQKKTAPEMVSQRYGMSVEEAREWFRVVRWSLDGKVDLDALEKVANVLAGTGMLERPIGPSELEAMVWTSPVAKKG